MKEKQNIIKLYMEGVGIREITRRTKKSRNTVRKYIREFEDSRKNDIRDLPITEEVFREPHYKKRKGSKTALTDEVIAVLRDCIKENEWKRTHHMAKQQMKIIDMHEKLLDKGFTISYSTVRNFVNAESAKAREVYIRRHCEPGYEVEFDWGEIKLVINGEIKKYSLAVFTLTYSNYRFAKIYESETQVCVLDVHTYFIDEIGFIPTVFTYDNMRTVVKKFVGTEREITDSMRNLSDYYQFKIRLCQPRKGNEKGHVERSVEFIRRKAFSADIHFSHLEEAEVHLTNILQKLNNRNHYEHKIKQIDLMKEERSISKPAIAPFDCAELIECRVTKYSTIVIRQNHYSVPEGHVGKYIKVKVGATTIKLFNEGELVAVHRRNWGLHNWIMDINHYLKTFQKKKGALFQSEALKQTPTKIKNIYYEHYTGKEKDFIELLIFINENNNLDRVLQAVGQLKQIRPDYVSTERIMFICEQQSSVNNYRPYNEETKSQSENNMLAYSKMFNQLEKESYMS